MEGSYVPGYHRNKIINEVRSTHFEMGRGRNEFMTTNKADYRGGSSEKMQIAPHSNASHIQITNDSPKFISSEFGAKYRSYTEEARIKPKRPEPAIQLSQSPGNYVTTSSKAYKKAERLESPDTRSFVIKKRNMRKHNFCFGDNERMNYKSAMQHDYFYDPSSLGANTVTDKDIKRKFTKSPEFNEKQGCYISTNYQEFKTVKPSTPIKVKKHQDSHNFIQENDSHDMASMTQTAFCPKKVENASLSGSKLYDLKSSHFTLGVTQIPYSLSSFQNYPSPIKQEPTKHKSVSPSGIKFGSDSANFNSNYFSSFANRPNSELGGIKVLKKNENSSNVNLGEESPSLISQSHSAHKYLSPSPAKLPFDTEKHLKTHHFVLGSDQKNFKPVSKDYGVPGSHSKPQDVREKSSQMKQSNWKFGNYHSNMKSDFQKEFEYRGGSERIQINKGEIRKTHFEIGGDNSKWQSSYSGNFHWIKPVADTNYKISIMN